MRNKLLLIRIALLVLALASLLVAYLLFPLCLEEYNQRLIETADWDEVVGIYFVVPWLSFSLFLMIGAFCLFLDIKLWCMK